ncbi:MAG: hypothetical protein WA941_12305 [Nitrososphaeraceae archaeon]
MQPGLLTKEKELSTSLVVNQEILKRGSTPNVQRKGEQGMLMSSNWNLKLWRIWANTMAGFRY